MYPYLGDFPTGATILFPFHTFSSVGASVTLTGLAVTDIEVYKGVSITQRASDNGYALIDTDGIDIDGRVGIHAFSIDTSDNSDAGFYAAGNEYWVAVDAVTIDGQTVRFVAGAFSIERAGGALALLKGANGVAAIKSDTAAILVDTGTTLDGKIDAIAGYVDTEVASIISTLGSAGAGLTGIPWNAAWDAEVQSEANDALVANHLDHLLAVDYDPASKPGVATALFNELIGNDAGVSQFTANALETAPSGANAPLHAGTAQGGTASTIQFDVGASATDNIYKLNRVAITSGTGAGQSRQILSYVGASTTATIAPDWIVSPAADSVFEVTAFGLDAATLQEVEDEVWNALRADHQIADTMGEFVLANIVKVQGNSTSADKLRDAFNGTGYAFTGCTVPWNAAWDAEVESEVADGLAVYDGPTNAEMEARTLVAANYGTNADQVAILSDTNAILVDTGTTLDAALAVVDANVDAILVDTGTTLDGKIDGIKAKTDQLSFSSGYVDATTRVLNQTPVAGGAGEPWKRG